MTLTKHYTPAELHHRDRGIERATFRVAAALLVGPPSSRLGMSEAAYDRWVQTRRTIEELPDAAPLLTPRDARDEALGHALQCYAALTKSADGWRLAEEVAADIDNPAVTPRVVHEVLERPRDTTDTDETNRPFTTAELRRCWELLREGMNQAEAGEAAGRSRKLGERVGPFMGHAEKRAELLEEYALDVADGLMNRKEFMEWTGASESTAKRYIRKAKQAVAAERGAA